MKKRDPLRFRKSEVGQKRFHQRGRATAEGLPRPATDRQLAFVILDEHHRTKVFVGQLLDEKLDGLGHSFPGRKPLAGRLRAESDSTASDAPSANSPWKVSGPAQVARPSKYDRPFISEMVNGVVRRQATLDALLSAFVTRPRYSIEDQLWTLLQLGLYQLVFMHGVPVHASVHETVELGRWAQQPRWCGFMNGVFRSIAREIGESFETEPSSSRVPVSVRPALLERRAVIRTAPDEPAPPVEPPLTVTPAPSNSPWPTAKAAAAPPLKAARPTPAVTSADPLTSSEARLTEIRYREIGKDVFPPPETDLPGYVAAAFGLPDWLVARWNARFSAVEMLEMAKWFDLRQPLSLRVNSLKTSRDDLLAELHSATIADPTTFLEAGDRPESIRYDGSFRIVDLPGFSDGRFTVQDETAMSAAVLLAPEPGERVLDLCAAPGTKTTHLAELMQGEGTIIATDIELARLRRIEENADRLGFSIIEPLVIREDLTELPQGPFDAILIDVPCSNTGVLGKRPEVRSRITQEDIVELSTIQTRLLNAAASLLRPGGRIVYSTCSVEPEENSGVISRFLNSHTDFEFVEAHEFIPGRPSDGGYQALIVRKL
ncbi:MAG: methyltransferase domain-containing protein [Planctomycetota bacterium]|nr:methyltransferase domain-containing protein [Planctomycetota bacterium]